MDWTEHLREVAAHLLEMAAIPGAVDYARHRRDELLANPIYSGLREELTRQQLAAKAEKEQTDASLRD